MLLIALQIPLYLCLLYFVDINQILNGMHLIASLLMQVPDGAIFKPILLPKVE